jgi:hypothetical protein
MVDMSNLGKVLVRKPENEQITRTPTDIVTCRGLGVTYKTGFGLDDWIYCTLYIHNSELQAIQRYR